MPTRTFSSFEAFFDVNLHADWRGMILGRKREAWLMTQMVINNLSVQWGRAGSSVVVEGLAKPGGFTIYVPTQRALGISINGHRFDQSSLLVIQTVDEFCIVNDASRWWFSVHVPNKMLAGVSGDATTPLSSNSMHDAINIPCIGMMMWVDA